MDTFKLHDIINMSVYSQDHTSILLRFSSHNDESFCHIRVRKYNKRSNYTHLVARSRWKMPENIMFRALKTLISCYTVTRSALLKPIQIDYRNNPLILFFSHTVPHSYSYKLKSAMDFI